MININIIINLIILFMYILLSSLILYFLFVSQTNTKKYISKLSLHIIFKTTVLIGINILFSIINLNIIINLFNFLALFLLGIVLLLYLLFTLIMDNILIFIIIISFIVITILILNYYRRVLGILPLSTIMEEDDNISRELSINFDDTTQLLGNHHKSIDYKNSKFRGDSYHSELFNPFNPKGDLKWIEENLNNLSE